MSVSGTAPVTEAPDTIEGYARRWWTLAALCLVLFVLAFDNTILNVSLPTLAGVFNASASELQWIVKAYILVYSGLLLTGGALSDRFGVRRMLLLGLIIFGTTRALTAFAGSAQELIIGRAAMGVGGAFLMPATLAIIKHIFTDGERTRAIAIWTATFGLGVAVGPVIGGWLVEHAWWGSVFLIHLPVTVITFVATIILVSPRLPTRNVPLDLLGVVLSTVGVGVLLYAITAMPTWGMLSLPFMLTTSIALILLGLFIWWESRVAHPMLDLSLFRNRHFSAAIQAIVLIYFVYVGLSFVLAQYLQYVSGYRPFEAGLRTVPLAASLLIFTLLAPTFVTRSSIRFVIVSGLLLAVAGSLALITAGTESGYLPILIALLLLGSGSGLTFTAGTDAVIMSVPKDKAGQAAAVNETGFELGSVLGIGILGTAHTAAYAQSLAGGTTLPETIRGDAMESVGAALALAESVDPTTREMVIAQVRQAFAGAMDSTALIGALVVLVSAIIALRFLPKYAADQHTSHSH